MTGRQKTKMMGLTLVEVLVAVGLLGLLIGLLVRVLMPGFSIFKHTRALAEAEQQMMVAQDRMVLALMSTDLESITVLSDPDLHAFSLLAHQGTASQPGYDPVSGRSVWRQGQVFSLRPSNGELRHLLWDGANPPVPPHTLPTATTFALTSNQLRTLCGANLENRLLARSVRRLELQPSSQRQWTLRLETVANTPKGPKVLQREVLVTPRIRGEFS